MMIGFFLKNKALFFDILLVVGGIIAFTYWDPLGIFQNKKLQSTANMVRSVKDIGQLVTAEYYGEVISSWKEFKLNEFPEDTITETAKDLFVDLKITLDANVPFRRLYDGETSKTAAKYGADFYYKFLTFLGVKYFNYDAAKVYNEKDGNTRRNYERKILKKLYDKGADYHKWLKKKYKHDDKSQIEIEYDNYIFDTPQWIEDEFYGFYEFLTGKQLSKGVKKRKEIVFIGRGKVQAGFDFDKLDEGNFLYDEANRTIHFFGIKPAVLSADINPWFIPQQKVKGFELVDYSGRVNFEDAKAVKKQCKAKLLDQARKADILKEAMTNGQEALRNFFALVLDEPDIKVFFHTHPFDLQYAAIAADTLVDINEALRILSIYRAERERAKKPVENDEFSMRQKRIQLFKYFIGKLNKLDFVLKGHPFNFYSMYAAQILKDTFNVSLTDRQLLTRLRDTLKIDPQDTLKLTTTMVKDNPWWFQRGDFRYAFNQTVAVLETEALTFENSDTVEITAPGLTRQGDTVLMNGQPITALDTILTEGKKYLRYGYPDSIIIPETFFSDIRYDLNYTLLLNDTLRDTAQVAALLRHYADTATYNPGIDTLNRMEIQTVIKVRQNDIIYRRRMTPLNNLVAGVENFIEKIQKK
jgi:hypothetical protein